MEERRDLMRRPESATERHPSWWLTPLAMPEETARDYVKSRDLTAKDLMTREVGRRSSDRELPVRRLCRPCLLPDLQFAAPAVGDAGKSKGVRRIGT
jgi:hypothetical protein